MSPRLRSIWPSAQNESPGQGLHESHGVTMCFFPKAGFLQGKHHPSIHWVAVGRWIKLGVAWGGLGFAKRRADIQVLGGVKPDFEQVGLAWS